MRVGKHNNQPAYGGAGPDPAFNDGEPDISEVQEVLSPLLENRDDCRFDKSPTTSATFVSDRSNANRPDSADEVPSRHDDVKPGFVPSVKSLPDRDPVSRRLWKPFWLSTTVLLAFASIFVIFVVVIALLYHFSERYQGLVTEKQSNYYVWKYGPTAVLIVINALWNQVDHANKISMPWKEIRKGPGAFEKASALDYVSPLMPVSLWMALRNRHWAVVLSIFGQISIMVTTIFSTGLFMLEPTDVTRQRSDFQLKSEFSLAKGWDPAAPTSPDAANLYAGIHRFGLPYPPGTSEDIIVPNIVLPELSSDVLDFKATAKGIKVEFPCETVPVTNITRVFPDQSSIGFVADVDALGCVLKGINVASRELPSFSSPSNPLIANTTHTYTGTLDPYTCNPGSNHTSSEDNSKGGPNDDAADVRIFIAVADVRASEWNETSRRYERVRLAKLTTALCRPSYFIGNFDIRKPNPIDGSAQATLSEVQEGSESQLERFPASNLPKIIHNTYGEMPEFTDAMLPPFFGALSMKKGQFLPAPAYLDPDVLLTASSEMFQGLAIQYFYKLTAQPLDQSQNLTGQITYTEDRLKAKVLSMGMMVGFLSLLAILSVVLVFIRPRSVVPMAPDSIASVALILASDPLLRGLIRRQTFPRESQDSREMHEAKTPDDSKGSGVTRWWRPLSGTTWYFILATALPIVFIGVLELLQQLSRRNNGISDIKSQNITIFTTYIPAIAALSVAALYYGLKFTSTLFTPYVALKRGKATSSRTLRFSTFTKLLPHAFYASYRSQHYALMMAMLGSFIGSFLTIITSGLFTAIDSPSDIYIPITTNDAFNLTIQQGSDFTAFDIASLIEFQNLEFPQWTYGELALGGLEQSTLELGNSSNEVPLTVVVPAMRPHLNCSTVASKRWRVTRTIKPLQLNLTGTHVDVFFETPIKHRDWCQNLTSESMSMNQTWSERFTIPANGQDIYISKSDNVFSVFGAEAVEHDCPTFSMILGSIRASRRPSKGDDDDYDVDLDLGTLLCYQNIETVDTKLNLKLPGFELDKNHPPVTDESTTMPFENDRGKPRFYSDPSTMTIALGKRSEDIEVQEGTDIRGLVDPFIIAVLHGRDGRPIQDVAGERNTANLTAAANGVYGRYMAQLLSSQRQPSDGNDPTTTYDGMATVPGRKRLHQNNTSKLILQVMLAVMVVSSIIARWLLPIGEVLPDNPASIKGVASLLVGGTLVSRDMLPSAEAWKDSTEAFLDEMFDGRVYTLKWWVGSDGQARYGIDIDETVRGQ